MTSKQTTSESEWEVHSEPRSTLIFETVGDEWEGFYEGPTTVHDPNTEEDYDYLTFRNAAGDPFQVSASYDLKQAFSTISTGTYVKIILTELKPSKRGNDVKLYKVLTRK